MTEYPTPEVPTDYPLPPLSAAPPDQPRGWAQKLPTDAKHGWPSNPLYAQNFNPAHLNTDKPLPAHGISPILEFFGYDHLPEHLQGVSRAFHDLAHEVEERLPSGPEKSVALRHLLYAKDAAVRVALHGTRSR